MGKYTLTEVNTLKCWVCGEEATKSRNLGGNKFGASWSESKPTNMQRNYCDKCFEKRNEEIRAKNELWLKLKRERMFEKAVDKLEHSKINFIEYEEAIKTIEEYNTENPDKFDSSYEIITAIMLLHDEIHIKPQFKVAGYQADFCLPDYHIILEIDGDRHNKTYDSLRDSAIKQSLGEDWEVVRIPTELIDKNPTKIFKGIKAVLEYRESKHVNWKEIYNRL